MAVGWLYITEFQAPGVQSGDTMGVSMGDKFLVSQARLDTSGASAASAAFATNTTLVRLHNDAGNACSIVFGTAPVATVGKSRMAKNQTEYYAVPRGQSFKVAVIFNPV